MFIHQSTISTDQLTNWPNDLPVGPVIQVSLPEYFFFFFFFPGENGCVQFHFSFIPVPVYSVTAFDPSLFIWQDDT